jgi:hypothetical protein
LRRGGGIAVGAAALSLAGLGAAGARSHPTTTSASLDARDYFMSKQPGQVVSQMPAPGQRVAPGTAVHVAVRKE